MKQAEFFIDVAGVTVKTGVKAKKKDVDQIIYPFIYEHLNLMCLQVTLSCIHLLLDPSRLAFSQCTQIYGTLRMCQGLRMFAVTCSG